MRDSARNDHQVHRAVADDLIGDLAFRAFRITRLRLLDHCRQFPLLTSYRRPGLVGRCTSPGAVPRRTRTGRVATAGICAELIRRLNFGRGGRSRPIAWRFGRTGCPARLLGGGARSAAVVSACRGKKFSILRAHRSPSPTATPSAATARPAAAWPTAHVRNKPKPPHAQQQSITLDALW
jgi:hypothetical protein